MVTKTDKVRALYESGDVSKALSIAKGFRLGLTQDERAAMQRAHEVLIRGGDFYRAIGKDPDVLVREGVRVLCERVVRL